MSTAATVRAYLEARPVIQQALAMQIVNLRALSRRIATSTGIDEQAAIQAALRRYRPPAPLDEDRLQGILERAQLDVRTRMVVVTTQRSWDVNRRLDAALRRVRDAGGSGHVVHGSEAITLIIDASYRAMIEDGLEASDVQQIRTGLAQVNVRTPADVEDVPGVLVRVAGVLAARNINSVEVLSCHKDNLFLIDEQELSSALEALRPVMASG